MNMFCKDCDDIMQLQASPLIYFVFVSKRLFDPLVDKPLSLRGTAFV